MKREKALPSDVDSYLRSVGWFPQRQVDDELLAEWIRIIVKEYGCPVFPEGVRILREYGKLTFGSGALHIDPLQCSMFGDPELWFLWQWEIGDVLFPIGVSGNTDTTYAVTPQGTIYAAGIGRYECGATFEEMIRYLFIFGGPAREMIELVIRANDPKCDDEAMKIYEAVKRGLNHDTQK